MNTKDYDEEIRRTTEELLDAIERGAPKEERQEIAMRAALAALAKRMGWE